MFHKHNLCSLLDDEKKQAREQAQQSAKDMQLNVVKLCFQAYLKDENGHFNRLLTPVLSTAIYDSSEYQPFCNVIVSPW